MASPPRTVTASNTRPQPGLQVEPAEAAIQFGEGDILLGKYRVERVIGQGGMGVVLAVRHLDLDELFAMKLMLPEELGSRRGVGRFLQEARAAARLKGEHIAKVFDVGRLNQDTPYMVMEYLRGSDLKELLQAHGPVPIEDAVVYGLQVCEGLAEAHAHGIVHRDLKPSNLFLIKRPNGSACIKVIDFGISKMIAPDGTAPADLTRSGAVVGTPLYMSPEQMMHAKSIDARSDVWAMGVVLYELVTGKVPFEGETMPQIVGQVLNHEPPPPSRLCPDLPEWLDAVVMRCLRKKPEERFQSIDDLAAALRSRTRVTVGAITDPALVPTVREPSAHPSPLPKQEGADSTLSSSTQDRTGGELRRSRATRAGILIGLLGAVAIVVFVSVELAQRSSSEAVVAPSSADTATALPDVAASSPAKLVAVTSAAASITPPAAPALPEEPLAVAGQASALPAPIRAAPSRPIRPPHTKAANAAASTIAPAPPPAATSTQPRREGVF